jgi:hypothetical protein
MFGVFKKSKFHHQAEFPKRREFIVNHETKYPLFLYRHLHKKMIEVIEAVFGGYPKDKYIFYPHSDWLCDRFEDVRSRFLEIDQSEPFRVLRVTSLRLFEPYANYKDSSLLWEDLKKDIYEEDQMLIKNTQFDYYLPDDLQVLFHKIDESVKFHTEEKNKMLKANHIYPTNICSSPFRKNSTRGKIFNLLTQANSEYISIQTISQKINERNLQYVRIVLNQLQKVFEKRKQPLKIESNRKGYYRLISIN